MVAGADVLFDTRELFFEPIHPSHDHAPVGRSESQEPEDPYAPQAADERNTGPQVQPVAAQVVAP